jgi:putative exosortase-associated protein (TIGR04073 family)
MNKFYSFLVAAALAVVASATAVAEDGAGSKFTRGAVGLLFGWLEIPNQMYETAVNDGPGMAATVGFAKGLGNMITRYAVSTYEFVTFPFPINDYKPVMQPEYPWGFLASEGNVVVPAPTSKAK